MERLTENFRGMGNCGITKHAMTSDGKANLSRFADKVITKLADYEEAEEQGLLLRLPCKVGDKVYLIGHTFVSIIKTPLQCVVDEFTVDKNECYAVLNGDVNIYMMRRFKAVNITNFGKTVFLTKEEAEQALKRMESE